MHLKNAWQIYQFTYANMMNFQYALDEASFVKQTNKQKVYFQ